VTKYTITDLGDTVWHFRCWYSSRTGEKHDVSEELERLLWLATLDAIYEYMDDEGNVAERHLA
jgi:hypothetical protein